MPAASDDRGAAPITPTATVPPATAGSPAAGPTTSRGAAADPPPARALAADATPSAGAGEGATTAAGPPSDVKTGEWRWVALAVGLVNVAVGLYALCRLGDALRQRHGPGEPALGMGQGWAREGLGGGRAAAEAAVGTWDAFARTHAGAKSADALAHVWLAIDTALFALGGYGLVSLVIVLLVRRVAWLPGWVRGCLLGAGILGMGTAALDVVENVLTHLVLAADGAGPAGLLRTWGSVKWLVAALALAAALVGVVAWAVAAKRAGVARPSGPRWRRLLAWARLLIGSLVVLVVAAVLLAALAGSHQPLPLVAAVAALFAVAAYRFNGALEARRATDRDSGQNFVTIRLIVGADLALVGASLAVTWLFVPGLHGVGFVGLVLGLFGASSLLGEFRWSKARARRILALVFLAACAVVAVAVLVLGWLSPTWGLLALVGALATVGMIGASGFTEDVLRDLSSPRRAVHGRRSRRRARRRAGWFGRHAMLALGAVLFLVGLAWFLVAVGWPLRNVVLLAVVLVGAALVVGSNWSSEAFIAVAAVALVWALGPRSEPPEERLQPQPGGQAIVVMGDSFSSGEGASRYYDGTNTTKVGETNKCRRAPTAFGPLLAERGIPADQLLFVACSGAKIVHLADKAQYPGEPVGRPAPQDPGLAPGLPQLDHVEWLRPPGGEPLRLEAVLVGIGGNDAGFGDVGGTCVAPGNCAQIGQRFLDELGGLEDRLVGIYGTIRDGLGEEVRLVAVPYPVPIAPDACSDSNFTADEHRFLDGFTRELDRIVARAARRADVEVMTTMADAFVPGGLGICMGGSGRPGVNYLAPGQEFGDLENQVDPRNWIHNSLHPNEAGHRAMADAAAAWFTTGEPAGEPDSDPVPAGEVRRLEDLMGPDFEHCGRADGGPVPARCDYEGGAWTAAQTLAAGRRNVLPGLLVFLGAWLMGVRFLLLWRRRRAIGTLAWADADDGRLSGREKVGLALPLAAGAVGYAADRAVRRVPRRRVPELCPPPPPSPALTREIAATWNELLGRAGTDRALEARLLALRNHSERTWRFGLALAHRDAVALDPEPFYLAAMAHDLGLAERILRPPGAEPFTACFTIAGARAAIDVARRTGLASAELRPGAVGDAIVNHITPGLSLTVDDPLAVYLQRGSLLDLTGQRSRRLPGELLDAAFREQPRTFEVEPGRTLRTARVVTDVWGSERAAVPDGRARFIDRCGLFRFAVAHAPFADGVVAPAPPAPPPTAPPATTAAAPR